MCTVISPDIIHLQKDCTKALQAMESLLDVWSGVCDYKYGAQSKCVHCVDCGVPKFAAIDASGERQHRTNCRFVNLHL